MVALCTLPLQVPERKDCMMGKMHSLAAVFGLFLCCIVGLAFAAPPPDLTDPYRPTTPDPYRPTTDPYRPTTPDPYEPITDPYEPTTDPYEPITDSYEPTTDPYEPTTDPYEPTTDPYEPTTDPYKPTTDPYEPTTDPYRPTTPDPYRPTTDPYKPTTPYPYRPTTEPYPYDPYEPYDPYDPYPNYFCELNEDEYGRPYYGPYDEYRPPSQPYPDPYRPTSTLYRPTTDPYRPTTPNTYRPTTPDPYRPTSNLYRATKPNTYRLITPEPHKLNTRDQYEPNTEPYKKRRQSPTLTLPSCVTSNECSQQSESCYGTGTQYDRCGRRCSCRGGRLVNCCRVRKEWRSMTQAERCRYVDVIFKASTLPPWKDCYDELIRIHRVQFNNGIHQQSFFLPWHRWYILALENLLRRIDCNVTVPYWDWSLEPQTWQNSIVWAVQCGLGGNGDPANNYYVSTGLFRQSNWQLTPSAADTDLRRRFNGVLPDCASVAMTQRLGIAEFNTWHTFISSNLHDAVHCNIGGTMCSRDSANAPEFFLHHGFIDKIWADWQNKGPNFKNLPYYSQNTDPMPAAFDHSPSNVYDLNSQPGCVRVCIEPSARPCRLNTTYTPVCPQQMGCYEYSPVKLAALIPRPYPSVPPAAYELFRTPYEIRRSSGRFSRLFNDRDEIYRVLQNNGYEAGVPLSHVPSRGELQFDRYIYQPIYATNTTAQVPPECAAYIPTY